MSYAAVQCQAAALHLDVFGAFHACAEDDLPERIQTLVLLGPREPGFWAHVTQAPEFQDSKPDPLDRWSRRTIGTLACALGGKAYFPFGGPPYRPFIAWAKRTGRAWDSEVGLLVHDRAGLMVSYRGALGLNERLDLPPAGSRPCDSCAEKPCLSACPISALTRTGYDIPACKSYVREREGRDCLEKGCAVRRSCPVSEGSGRLPEQSSYHMRRFLG